MKAHRLDVGWNAVDERDGAAGDAAVLRAGGEKRCDDYEVEKHDGQPMVSASGPLLPAEAAPVEMNLDRSP